MALIAVLWIISLLAIMAAGIGSTGRVTSKLAYNNIDNTKARLLAEAGINKATYDLIHAEAVQPSWEHGSFTQTFKLDADQVAVQVFDEAGKIDLNNSKLILMQRLLQQIGLSEPEAATFSDRIADYVDRDSEPRPLGVEIQGDYAARNKPYETLEELRAVLGMTEVIFERLRPHITVYSNNGRIDPFRASDKVLWSLPGMTPEIFGVIRANPDATDLSSILPEEMVESFSDYLDPTSSRTFHVRSLGETEEGARFVREAVLEVRRGRRAYDFKTYAWRQSAMPRANDSDIPADAY